MFFFCSKFYALFPVQSAAGGSLKAIFVAVENCEPIAAFFPVINSNL